MMKHTANELYNINGKGYYTEAYITANNITIAKNFRYKKEGEAYPCITTGVDAGTKRVHDVDGIIIIYTYGEKTWFDTEAERDEYRAKAKAEREEQKRRRELLKTITEYYDALTTEQLAQVVSSIK